MYVCVGVIYAADRLFHPFTITNNQLSVFPFDPTFLTSSDFLTFLIPVASRQIFFSVTSHTLPPPHTHTHNLGLGLHLNCSEVSEVPEQALQCEAGTRPFPPSCSEQNLLENSTWDGTPQDQEGHRGTQSPQGVWGGSATFWQAEEDGGPMCTEGFATETRKKGGSMSSVLLVWATVVCPDNNDPNNR